MTRQCDGFLRDYHSSVNGSLALGAGPTRVEHLLAQRSVLHSPSKLAGAQGAGLVGVFATGRCELELRLSDPRTLVIEGHTSTVVVPSGMLSIFPSWLPYQLSHQTSGSCAVVVFDAGTTLGPIHGPAWVALNDGKPPRLADPRVEQFHIFPTLFGRHQLVLSNASHLASTFAAGHAESIALALEWEGYEATEQEGALATDLNELVTLSI